MPFPPHMRRAGLLLLTTVLLGAHCEICESPGVNVSSAELVEGQIRWTKGDEEGDLPIRQGAAPAADSLVCTLKAYIGSSDPANGNGALAFLNDEPRFSRVEGWVRIACESPEEGRNNNSFRVATFTSDPREWPLGEVTDLMPRGDLVSFESCIDGRCTICESDLAEASFSARVIEAVGGSAAAPDAVTDDFRRTIEVIFDTGAPLVGTPRNDDEECAAPLTATGNVSFTWDASHFRRQTDPCAE